MSSASARAAEPEPVLAPSLTNDTGHTSYWVFEGAIYDLTSFVAFHPGGRILVDARGFDITAFVYIYHPNVAKIKTLLKEYYVGEVFVTEKDAQFPLYRTEDDRTHTSRELAHLPQKLFTFPAASADRFAIPAGFVPSPLNAPSGNGPISYYALPTPEAGVPPWLHPEMETHEDWARAFIFKHRDTNYLSTFRDSIRNKLKQGNIKASVEQADYQFRVHTMALFFIYMVLQIFTLYNASTLFGSLYYDCFYLVLICCLRTALAGSGHYFLHTPSSPFVNWTNQLFDMAYVGAHCTALAGHVLLHHGYTMSFLDSKELGITGFRKLPRLYRIPIHSIHKFFQQVTGALLRQLDILFHSDNLTDLKKFFWHTPQPLPLRHDSKHNKQHQPTRNPIQLFLALITFLFLLVVSLFIRILLTGEIVLFWYAGFFDRWCIQFAVTLWWNTCVLVSNHHLDDKHVFNSFFSLNQRHTIINTKAERALSDKQHVLNPTQSPYFPPVDKPRVDWAQEQLQNAIDLQVTGFDYIDCWLTAGLSCHRVHHLLPSQQSAYANIVSERIVREEMEKIGMKWEAPKQFITTCIPVFVRDWLINRPVISAREAFGLGFPGYRNLNTKQLNEPLDGVPLYPNIIAEHLSPRAIIGCIGHIVHGIVGANI